MPARRPLLLDLFCGAGGAATGYHRAGFDVIGVDNRRQPHYPFPFVQADALDYLAAGGVRFDAVHASPPCQAYTSLAALRRGEDEGGMLFPLFRPARFAPTVHPDLVAATRAALTAAGRPWVIENVPGAPLRAPVMLCGTMFGLGAQCRDGIRRALWRHRLFEASFPVAAPGPCRHTGQPVGVYGTGAGGARNGRYQANAAESAAAMGIEWAPKERIRQAIPPAYAQHIGAALIAHVAQVTP